MITIISGTNRPQSRTRIVAGIALEKFQKLTPNVELIDLAQLPFEELTGASYGKVSSPRFQKAIESIDKSHGLYLVVPEYNGSYPGALKYFIDFWSYPKSFEYRPVAFVGLGFRWGGLRPVEHLQQVFNYRNSFLYPERVFLSQITDVLKDGKIVDANINGLLDRQIQGFVKYINGLKSENLHANQQSR